MTDLNVTAFVPIGSAALCRNLRFYAGLRMGTRTRQHVWLALWNQQLPLSSAGVRNAEVVGSSPMRSTTHNLFEVNTYWTIIVLILARSSARLNELATPTYRRPVRRFVNTQGDVHQLHLTQRQPAGAQPGEEPDGGPSEGQPGVGVPELGGEELDEGARAQYGLRTGRDHRGDRGRVVRHGAHDVRPLRDERDEEGDELTAQPSGGLMCKYLGRRRCVAASALQRGRATASERQGAW